MDEVILPRVPGYLFSRDGIMPRMGKLGFLFDNSGVCDGDGLRGEILLATTVAQGIGFWFSYLR